MRDTELDVSLFDPERRFYNSDDAAAYLTRRGIRCKACAVRKWAAEGKIKGAKFGDVWYYSRTELDRFLDRLEVKE
jgi:hypothetical protein